MIFLIALISVLHVDRQLDWLGDLARSGPPGQVPPTQRMVHRATPGAAEWRRAFGRGGHRDLGQESVIACDRSSEADRVMRFAAVWSMSNDRSSVPLWRLQQASDGWVLRVREIPRAIVGAAFRYGFYGLVADWNRRIFAREGAPGACNEGQVVVTSTR